MTNLRFLVLSDVHMRERVIGWANRIIQERGLDGVIVLGDITHFGPPQWAEEFLRSLEGKVYAIPGNCDPGPTLAYIEKGATSLHGRRVQIGAYDVVGWGGSNPTIFDTPNEMPEEEIYENLRMLMVPGAILVLHCPPRGTNDLTFSGSQGGSVAIERIVREFRPRAVLSGHIHEARGLVEKEGTLFLNPGAAKDGHAAIFTIDGSLSAELLDRVSQ